MIDVVVPVLLFALNVFFAVLICRLVLDWIQALAREWRPRGPILVFSEGVYTVTDPKSGSLSMDVEQIQGRLAEAERTAAGRPGEPPDRPPPSRPH